MLSTRQRNVIKAKLHEEFSNKESEVFDLGLTHTSSQALANLVMMVVLSEDCFPDFPDSDVDKSIQVIATRLEEQLDAMAQDDVSYYNEQFLERLLSTACEMVSWILPKTVDTLSERVLGMVRQHQGAEDERDTSKDALINVMSKTELFTSVLEWEGIQGYAESIISWVEEIYGITLPRE